MRRLTQEEKNNFFNVAITILSNGFPNTWNTVTSHQFTAWAKCEMCLPHVNFLIEQTTKYSLKATDPRMFSELILRCCWCVLVCVCMGYSLDANVSTGIFTNENTTVRRGSL